MLEAFGYRVLAGRPTAPRRSPCTPSRQDEIAAVITDMMMPVMDGPATIRALTNHARGRADHRGQRPSRTRGRSARTDVSVGQAFPAQALLGGDAADRAQAGPVGIESDMKLCRRGTAFACLAAAAAVAGCGGGGAGPSAPPGFAGSSLVGPFRLPVHGARRGEHRDDCDCGREPVRAASSRISAPARCRRSTSRSIGITRRWSPRRRRSPVSSRRSPPAWSPRRTRST